MKGEHYDDSALSVPNRPARRGRCSSLRTLGRTCDGPIMTFAVKDTLLNTSVASLLERAVGERSEEVYLTFNGKGASISDVASGVDLLVRILQDNGVRPGSRVAVALSNRPLYLVLILSLLDIGAVWIPVNMRLKGPTLSHVFADSQPTLVIAEEGPALAEMATLELVAAGSGMTMDCAYSWLREGGEPVYLFQRPDSRPVSLPDAVRAVLYTSGTTGPAKGAMLTERMLRASALGALVTADATAGDVMYLWEPLYHIGGAQGALIPLVENITLALGERFSASSFWEEIARTGSTHVHYLGGIMQILLKQQSGRHERIGHLRTVWGAGVTPEVWHACRKRFDVSIHECYGQTEASSVCTINKNDPEAGIGWAVPWFEVRLLQADGGEGAQGEIAIRGRDEGLITPGYLGNEEATLSSWDGDWWRTGDLARRGQRGEFHYLGRANDSVRIGGENVSSWEVESVFASHPQIQLAAMVGIRSDLGEQEMKLFVQPAGLADLDLRSLVSWAKERLAPFQIPKYIAVVTDLPLTPSERVAKAELDRTIKGCYTVDC